MSENKLLLEWEYCVEIVKRKEEWEGENLGECSVEVRGQAVRTVMITHMGEF